MDEWQKLRRLYIDALEMTGNTDSVVCQNIGRGMIQRGFGNHLHRLIGEIGRANREAIAFMCEELGSILSGAGAGKNIIESDKTKKIIENDRWGDKRYYMHSGN